MAEHSMICAGIDVAKTKLDAVIYPGGAHLCVAYDAPGLKRLDAFFQEHNVRRVGFEASGGYEWVLLVHLRGGPIAAARFQPGQVRHFAKSRLRRAKNDKLDARIIAAFTASLEAMPPLPDARLDALDAELTYLEQLDDQIATLKTMVETTRPAHLKRLHEADIARLEKRRKKHIALMVATLNKDAALGRRLELLVSIGGVGTRTALAMLIGLPELGSISREEAAALVGVAPFDDDTGQTRRRRHVRGGRSRLRKSVFMGAFCATQWNPDLKAFYKRLRGNNKSHLCAIIAVARKLVILANAIVARKTPHGRPPLNEISSWLLPHFVNTS
jgi:transposase